MLPFSLFVALLVFAQPQVPPISAGEVAARPVLERRIPFKAGELRACDEAENPLIASVYSLPSQFFSAETAEGFLAGVRKAAPDRTLIVLTDLPLRQEGKTRILNTHGRRYSPWPRDPFSLVRSPSGPVRVLVRPNLQAGREEDAKLGLELIQDLPDDLDRAWGGVAWAESPIPFHNGQVLLTRDAAWVSLHTLEPHILAALKVDRVPVESFSTAEGVNRYLAAARKAAEELGTLYGRPVRFVHPLSSENPSALMRSLGGGAGYDLDSIVTLLPREGGLSALVADFDLGRELVKTMTPDDWKALREGYGLAASVESMTAAQTQAAGLDGFLDLIAEHLAKEGLEVRRLPILSVPVALLRDRENHTHSEFLITWNNVVAEVRNGHLRAEGFSSLIPTGDRIARDTFAAAGASLDLLPPLVRSVVLNGGYRCASNHVRSAK